MQHLSLKLSNNMTTIKTYNPVSFDLDQINLNPEFHNVSWVNLVATNKGFKYEPNSVNHAFHARTRRVVIRGHKYNVETAKLFIQQELKRRHEHHKQDSVIGIHDIKYVCDVGQQTSVFLVRSNVN